MRAKTDVDVAGRNPQTFEEASRLVKHVEGLFMPWDFEGLLAGFTDDCVVRYAEFPQMHGKAELDKFFRGRAARQKEYWLKKDLRLLMGDMIANSWECRWIDTKTDKKMWGWGMEMWTMRDGKIAIWEGTLNFNEEGKRDTGIV